MYYNLNAEDIQQNTDILVRLHGEFADFFRTSTRSVVPHGLDYLKGQLLLESRRNRHNALRIRRISEAKSRRGRRGLPEICRKSPS